MGLKFYNFVYTPRPVITGLHFIFWFPPDHKEGGYLDYRTI